MVNALGMARGGSSKGGGDRLAHFITGKGISPFVNSELLEVIKNPSSFKTAKLKVILILGLAPDL